MDNMSILKMILNIIIIGFIIYIVANLFIALLPIVLILIGIYYVYKVFIDANRKKERKSNKKDDIVVDAEIIEEKFDK